MTVLWDIPKIIWRTLKKNDALAGVPLYTPDTLLATTDREVIVVSVKRSSRGNISLTVYSVTDEEMRVTGRVRVARWDCLMRLDRTNTIIGQRPEEERDDMSLGLYTMGFAAQTLAVDRMILILTELRKWDKMIQNLLPRTQSPPVAEVD